ncbi:MAG: hypothetical protein ACK5PR_03715, partial [bacterium]
DNNFFSDILLLFNNERKPMHIQDILKSRYNGECPAKRISYAAIADTLRGVFNPKLDINADYPIKLKEQEYNWLMSDEYSRSVDRAGGCSFEYCCLSLDFSPEIFRETVKLLLSNKRKYNQHIRLLLDNLYSYNYIYYNIYNKL